MQLAPPIVSQAFSFLTKFLSSSIFFTEYANDNVTESGSPSGIATTITTIARIKNFTNSPQCLPWSQESYMILSTINLIKSTAKIAIDEYSPKYPISLAIASNFICNGVASGSSYFNKSLIFPMQLISPTTITIILPSPVITFN
jgi:hypothetical protein